eukprot:6214637-Pleurochrysis_carterae.AAC.3
MNYMDAVILRCKKSRLITKSIIMIAKARNKVVNANVYSNAQVNANCKTYRVLSRVIKSNIDVKAEAAAPAAVLFQYFSHATKGFCFSKLTRRQPTSDIPHDPTSYLENYIGHNYVDATGRPDCLTTGTYNIAPAEHERAHCPRYARTAALLAVTLSSAHRPPVSPARVVRSGAGWRSTGWDAGPATGSGGWVN